MKLKLAALWVLVLASVLVPAASASAIPNGMTATVNKVLVSRLGGITVSGTMNCKAAVDAYYADLNETVPDNLTVLVTVQWTATQPVGRNKSVTATWRAEHLNPCYNSNPDISGAELCPVAPVPCSWITSFQNSSDTPYYVYPTNGKFAPGPIHVDLTTEGSNYIFIDGVLQDGVSIDVFSVTGFNLRAVRVR